MMDDIDSGSVSLRRKGIVDVFAQRGEFSPLSASRARSEIPRNTLEFQPRDALFVNGGCYGCRRWFSRHSRVISSCITAVVCITVILLLIGSLYYHISRSYGKTDKNVYHSHQPHLIKPAEIHEKPANEIINEEEAIEESIESELPLEIQPPRHRVVAQVLEDSRELDDLPPIQNILFPEQNIPAKMLAQELAKAKLRYRRSLPSYYLNRQFHKSNNVDCDDEVGAVRMNPSVRSKLQSMLAEILDIKKKLRDYEESLQQFTQMPFKDFNLYYPVRQGKLYGLPFFPKTPPTQSVPVIVEKETESSFIDMATITVTTKNTEYTTERPAKMSSEKTGLIGSNAENSSVEVTTEAELLDDSSDGEIISISTSDVVTKNDVSLIEASDQETSSKPDANKLVNDSQSFDYSQDRPVLVNADYTSKNNNSLLSADLPSENKDSAIINSSEVITTDPHESFINVTDITSESPAEIPVKDVRNGLIETSTDSYTDKDVLINTEGALNESVVEISNSSKEVSQAGKDDKEKRLFETSTDSNDSREVSKLDTDDNEKPVVETSTDPNTNRVDTNHDTDDEEKPEVETSTDPNTSRVVTKLDTDDKDQPEVETSTDPNTSRVDTRHDTDDNEKPVDETSTDPNTSRVVSLNDTKVQEQSVFEISADDSTSNGILSTNSETPSIVNSTIPIEDQKVSDKNNSKLIDMSAVAPTSPTTLEDLQETRSPEVDTEQSTSIDKFVNTGTESIEKGLGDPRLVSNEDSSQISIAFSANLTTESPVEDTENTFSSPASNIDSVNLTNAVSVPPQKLPKPNLLNNASDSLDSQEINDSLSSDSIEFTEPDDGSILFDSSLNNKSSSSNLEKLRDNPLEFEVGRSESSERSNSTQVLFDDNFATNRTENKIKATGHNNSSSASSYDDDAEVSSEENNKVTSSSEIVGTTTLSSIVDSLVTSFSEKDKINNNDNITATNENRARSNFDSQMSQDLEEEMLKKGKENNPNDKKQYEVFGLTLEEARNKNNLASSREKWGSKVVTDFSDIKLTTGPDSSAGLGESLKTSQQLSYSPNGFSHIVIPYQMCFYPNPSPKDLPAIRNSRSLFPLPQIPGYKLDTSTSSSMPQQNVFNIVMNNNPSQLPVPMHFSSPGVLTFPSQQQLARYMNGQQQPLFCTPIQSPAYQFPTVPGTTDFNSAKCINCDNSQIAKSIKAVYANEEKYDGMLNCPEGLSRCKDDQLCIPSDNWCDGKVHCSDASDERHCSCKDRVGDLRQCDGYIDCPDAEDEIGCFECPVSSFYCGTYDQEGSCIDLSKRCNGITDCTTGRDEEDCSILAPSLANASHLVSYDEGFLLRNWRGRWYPVCTENGIQAWAQQACSLQSGNIDDLECEHRDIPAAITGPFLTHRSDANFILEHHCKGHVALHVKCPPPKCGTRVWRSAASDDLVSRIRRLVEPGTAPKDARDRPLAAWLERVKEQSKSYYKVDNVVAEIVPMNRGGVERPKRAGRTNGGEEGRVVGGHSSEANAWPWAVALYRDGHFHCGAVLLDRDWVLTAAHCVTKFWDSYYEVRVGMWRRFSFAPMEQVRTVSHVITHENYDYSTMKNDLAILHLAEPVVYSRWVRPTCLPAGNPLLREGPWGPAPGSSCIAIGWGAIKEHGMDPNQLREVEVPILEQCKHRADVEGNEICAGLKQGGKDTCQGDSGGALMCRDSSSSGAWYVAGVVSHGEGCARPDEPGVYTRVLLFSDWLVKHTSGALPAIMPKQHCPGFQCSSPPGMCIPAELRCNGVANCLHAEDEVGCRQQRNFRSETENDNDTDTEPIVQMKREQPNIGERILNYTVTYAQQKHFKCLTILQSILLSRRCDGIKDCTDASDEDDCSCHDQLASQKPNLLCDGVANCEDLSDEKPCYTCPEGYFNCRRSRQCVQAERKCDGNPDCTGEEDEDNCYALTDDFNLVVDEIGEPTYKTKGFIVENIKGSWSVKCFNDVENLASKLASRVCRSLGLIGYEKSPLQNIPSVNFDLNDKSMSLMAPIEDSSISNCSGLYVTCTKRIIGMSDEGAKGWEVVLRVEGEVTCSAVLLTGDWVLASQYCFTNITHFENVTIVGEFAKQKYPPTTIRIDAIKSIPGTDIVLLHLETSVNESKVQRPLQVPYYKGPEDLKKCLAVGVNETVKVSLLNENCTGICGTRVGRPARRCRSDPWVGAVVCNSKDGLLPVSVFKETGGLCGFQRFNYTNILQYLKEINSIIDSNTETIPELPCDGMRCVGGKCIPKHLICNGWPQCPYNDDETSAACLFKQSENGSSCSRNQLQCLDGTCITHTQFNDTVPDCPDGSDEPDQSTCASYLRLAAPWRICDGSRHCFDKSDENPALCAGRVPHNTSHVWFTCSKSNTTIPKEFLCDGEMDCLDGEDELNCLGMQRMGKFSNTYEYRNMSYGVWHSLCESAPSLQVADLLCKKAGKELAGELIKRQIVPKELTLDHFTRVTLNNRTKLTVRGDRPFVSLQSAIKPCSLTFITCY